MRWLTALTLALLLLTGCGDDDDAGREQAETTTTTAEGSATTRPTADATGYDEDVEASFLETCTAGAGEDLTDVCQCIYDGSVAAIPFEQFQAFDQALSLDPTTDLPPAFVDVYTDCVLEAGEG